MTKMKRSGERAGLMHAHGEFRRRTLDHLDSTPWVGIEDPDPFDEILGDSVPTQCVPDGFVRNAVEGLLQIKEG
ncbi:hypothetical protein Y032_0633g900 [Ancylostoma ceylanicum]|uniref:Uncharacterized protein n=1 Tax=Ancylostoma ceylanicum TaxID=53326 RepID=A0A016WK57_9BILA|nr:hypothetical protein Y032_0633g900 [Ancylostoma ceylanicum]